MLADHFLAIDIGASSGRAILGSLHENTLKLKEVHRFDNQMLFENGHYHWDVEALFEEIKKGLRLCVEQIGIKPRCLGIDTWGVDFGFLNHPGTLAGRPFAYRDHISDNAMDEVFSKIPKEELYQKTGIQFMQFNSLFQLWGLKKHFPDQLLSVDKMLFMPDLLSYLLTGIKYSEYTIASTSQMLNPETGRWNISLLQSLGLPTHILEEIVEPGTVIGHILPEIQADLGVGPIQVAAVAAHDTASAIASIPAKGDDWAYISSGTWSLMGIELPEPCITDASFKASFTNEGGIEGTTRFLKNITGLWLLQECKKIWDLEKVYSYADLTSLSTQSRGFLCLIDPDDPSFLNPENMIDAIQKYCKKTDQHIPETIPDITRCIFESLALKYRHTLNQLISASGKTINRIHLIGGGSRNKVLSQFTANATGLEIIAGPAEGTALGNILLQAKAVGILADRHSMRRIVMNSVETQTYHPKNKKIWDVQFDRFHQIIGLDK
ncbi:MAG: rhamnulokinase [Bacteroidetes bacterium]|jgi:rhamnulokinase|nr:rhamnulokinase [Bacteroidota bacterium]MBT4400236.1 rhamnulokinase [Bacteroidota bacterium]MBT4409252.1 rhamnulokinase [Bacteroidota bacterium]MBT5426743.1 rhamnulokinase [Bacteroidota bacterium]MBT7092732.1 rhamnulokinase [Bacteroidota bacterium]